MLENGSFTEGWETLDPIPAAGYLRNQRPLRWKLEWLQIGDSLFGDAHTAVTGIAECVHKLSHQLPPNEQLGATNALILEGDATYKIFSYANSFGATLSQIVTGLQPYTQATLTVPVQVHLRGETDPHGAESGVWVDGKGHWVHGFDMGDRRWYRHIRTFAVPASGQVEIVIRVKSKWARGKDFFLDGITLDAQPANSLVFSPPITAGPGPLPSGQVVYLQAPHGMQIEQGLSYQPNVIQVNLPPGTQLEMI